MKYPQEIKGSELSKLVLQKVSKVEEPQNESPELVVDKFEELDSKFEKDIAKRLNLINRSLNSVHEHVSPKYTRGERDKYKILNEYGGITGTLRPSCFVKILKILTNKLSDEFKLTKNSLFCDVGCGTGRPVFYLASMNIRASIGFDIDPMQVYNSCRNFCQLDSLEKKYQRPLLQCKHIGFFHYNALEARTIEPITHVYSFLGDPELVTRVTQLVCRSETVKIFIPVVLHQKELRETGILENEKNVVKLNGLQMPSGSCYTAFIIPVTNTRRKKVLTRADPFHKNSSDFAARMKVFVENQVIASDQFVSISTKIGFAKRKSRVAAKCALKRIKNQS